MLSLSREVVLVVGSGIGLFPGNSAMVVLGVTGVAVLSAFDCQYTSQATVRANTVCELNNKRVLWR
jgi:hypothetical protein